MARSSTSKKGAKADNRKKEAEREENQEKLKAEAVIIGLFALSVLLFLCNFGLCGVAGGLLRALQLGLFGALGYLFPVVLFLSGVFRMSNRDNPAALKKIPAAFIAFISIAGIIHLFFGESLEDAGSLAAFYREQAAGGLIGGMLAGACRAIIGKAGAFIILLVTFIISMVCVTEKSFVNAIKAGGEKAYRHTREDIERHREIRAERQRNRKAEVSGVDLDSTDLSAAAQPADASSGNTQGTDFMPGDTAEGGGTPETVNPETANPEPEAEFVTPEEAVGAENPVSAFNGTILKPADYEEDSVPFDTEEDPSITDACRKADEILKNSGEREEEPYEQETGDYPDPETDAYYQQTIDAEGGERTVVTSMGKIIRSEKDPEVVHRKMTEAQKATDVGEVKSTIEEKEKHRKPYTFPPLNLMERPKKAAHPVSDREYRDTAVKLQETLRNFGVGVTVTNISCGPVVTRYELHPEQGVKVSRIVALSDDIKLSLAASDIRIEAPIPGKSAVGIEVPNKENNMVYLRELLESDEFRNNKYKIAFALGKDIGGQIVVTDISKMPHLLIAGATGSGKSVCINTLIMSVLYKYTPEEVQLLMIDPKVVELSVYNGIPHLLIPVVTDPKKAAGALNWAVAEMTKRYKDFANAGVRDLRGYNDRIDAAKESRTVNKEELPQKMPQIVIIIDELADLMMVAQSEVEDAICRLAQLARAAGIHLVIATQRPSVNVITGLIKANIPSRIAFAVASGIDSRTILDGIGAEKLLGKGDMLFSPQGAPKPMRIQGAFVSDKEVQRIVDYICKQGFTLSYTAETADKIARIPEEGFAGPSGGTAGRDELFAQAGHFIIEKDKASIGNLERMFKIGFNRAARIMDQLCDAGVVGEEQGTKPREILMDSEQFDILLKNSEM